MLYGPISIYDDPDDDDNDDEYLPSGDDVNRFVSYRILQCSVLCSYPSLQLPLLFTTIVCCVCVDVTSLL